jgi:hypothetical protein
MIDLYPLIRATWPTWSWTPSPAGYASHKRAAPRTDGRRNSPRELVQLVEDSERLEATAPAPACVAFRYRPAGWPDGPDLDRLDRSIQRDISAAGDVLATGASLANTSQPPRPASAGGPFTAQTPRSRLMEPRGLEARGGPEIRMVDRVCRGQSLGVAEDVGASGTRGPEFKSLRPDEKARYERALRSEGA